MTERDEGISYIPDPKLPKVHAGQYSVYPVMKPGLRMFGAGMQVSFLHNLIMTPVLPDRYYPERSTIVIDGTGGHISKGGLRCCSWQQTGELRDFHITSTGHIDKTVGIDLIATWAYSIRNVAIMNMGSHGIIIRNLYYEVPTSDLDQSDKLYLDNVFVFRNEGWGIIVDAVERALSTSKIHIERCKIEQNYEGGINWTGIGGVIEQCGIYANGVRPKGMEYKGKILEMPEYIDGAHGILIKNVKGTSNGLLITGCEIQGNADVQIMVEVGANIKITQNDFKDDNLDRSYSFPSIDIQVGDGNLGDVDINYLNYPDKSKIYETVKDSGKPVNEIELKTVTDYETHQVIVLQGTPKNETVFYFPVTKVGQWILKNDTNRDIMYGKNVMGTIKTVIGRVLPKSWKSIRVYENVVTKTMELRESPPRAVNNCIMEDNRARISWNDQDTAPWGAKIPMPPHTVVKVNSNAIGTMIRGWWYRGPNENDIYKLVDLVENDPLTHDRIPRISPTEFGGRMHINTSLHRDEIDGGHVGGHVLLPFASTQENISLQWQDYTPNTSRYCSYRFRLVDNVMVLNLKNPTTRTIGIPLFLEFVNGRKDHLPVLVKFGDEYSITDLTIPPAKTVTGILLFGIGSKWIPFSPWTCEGKSL